MTGQKKFSEWVPKTFEVLILIETNLFIPTLTYGMRWGSSCIDLTFYAVSHTSGKEWFKLQRILEFTKTREIKIIFHKSNKIPCLSRSLIHPMNGAHFLAVKSVPASKNFVSSPKGLSLKSRHLSSILKWRTLHNFPQCFMHFMGTLHRRLLLHPSPLQRKSKKKFPFELSQI